jgi:glycosyltransferase involved in cell wall biosynthesis
MKILFDASTPFMLAHGGAQVQIEQTKTALEKIGVSVENLRWWDEAQTGDILHYMGKPPAWLITLAQNKGWKFAATLLLTETCNRSEWELFTRRVCIRSVLASPIPRRLKQQLPWQAYRMCDEMIVGLEAERRVLEKVYGIKKERTSVVPLGLAESFLKSGLPPRTEGHLICTGTIGPSKNSIELAQLAIAAQVPILFVGKPFDFTGTYWEQFRKLIDGKIVKHHPHVGAERELIDLLQRARGFVLMSRYENWSLAAHEAAGCGLPLLVPDQPWSRERFGDQASYFPKKGDSSAAAALRKFYDACPAMPSPKPKLYSWEDAARILRDIYTKMLNRSDPP